MKTREEIANELYKKCLDLIPDPPTLDNVRLILLFIGLIMSGNQIDKKSDDELKKVFDDLVQTEAIILNNYIGAGPELMEAVRTSAAEYMRTWENNAPSEVWDRETDELKEMCRTTAALPFSPVRAKNFIRPNTLVANMLPNLVNKGATEITTGRKKSKNPLTETVVVTMNPREVEGVKVEGNYDLFREAVFCAILSLFIAGNRTFTPHMVRRFLSQDYKNNDLSRASIAEITRAIEDLRIMHLKIDISDEVERMGINPDGPTYYGAFMLYLEDIELQIGGEKVNGYLIIKTPLLYEHALRLNQIQTFPAALLSITDPTTGKKLRSTSNRTKIQIYLLQQIANIKNDLTRAKKELNAYESRRAKNPAGMSEKKLSDFRKINDKILFSTVFQKADLSGKQNKQLLEYKSYIKICLDNWGEEGAKKIKGYTILHDGKRKDIETGVRIFVD